MMRSLFFVLIILMMSLSLTAVTVYDIQHTTNPNGDSPLVGQTVTVTGVVTGVGYGKTTNSPSPKYFISDPEGGLWSGIYVYDYSHTPAVGDMVTLTATVSEYYNFTELGTVSSFTINSHNNPLPPAMLVTTGTLSNAATAEQYEGVLVKVENATVVSMPSSYNEFNVNDGSGPAQIDDSFFPLGYVWTGISMGQTWAEIKGIVDYYAGAYGINPRSTSDMILTENLSSSVISLSSINTVKGAVDTVSVITSKLRPAWNVRNYRFKVSFDHTILQFDGLATDNTISRIMPDYTLSANEDTVTVVYADTTAIVSNVSDVVLIKMLFRAVNYGAVSLGLSSFTYNTTNITALSGGTVTIPITQSIAWLQISNSRGSKNIFNPWDNETLAIKYGAKAGNSTTSIKAILRIYDVQGRLVATPINKNISSPNGMETYNWNGRDRVGNLLPLGVYYCHLEIINRSTGKSETTVQPIVVADRLK